MHLNVESDEAGADASIPDPERDQCAYTQAADGYDSYSNGCTAARLAHSELPVPNAVPFPSELSAVRPQVEAYAQARICSFAHVFARVFAQQTQVKLTPDGIDSLTGAILSTMCTTAAAPAAAEPGQQEQQRRLQLVLRHTCLSSGCGEASCDLCRYNPSRLCRNNLKHKYLIDDHLKAKCGGALHVVVVDELDEQLQAVTDALTDAVLEVHILSGDKYKELASNGDAQGLLSQQQLRTCIVTPTANSNKPLLPLLKRETGFTSVPWDMRMLLPLEDGRASLSDLQCTTSSEALLQGKAPTFRLLVWAVDRISGMPLPAVGYAVSESFVVATKRVKHALKNDIPCIDDDISKLLHVGKATIDKLKDIKKAAAEEGKELHLPDVLNQIAKVGQFRELVEMTELSNDLKQKLRQLLKFSPEKWEELAQHALSAVVPDYRPRVWWCSDIKGGLVFPCRGGAAQVEQQPLAFVYREAPGKTETVMPLQQVQGLGELLPMLRQQAKKAWLDQHHPGWAVYWNDSNDPWGQKLQGLSLGTNTIAQQMVPLGVAAAAAVSATRGNAAVAASAAAAAVAAATDSAAAAAAAARRGSSSRSDAWGAGGQELLAVAAPPPSPPAHSAATTPQQQQQQQLLLLPPLAGQYRPAAAAGQQVQQQQQQQQLPMRLAAHYHQQQQQVLPPPQVTAPPELHLPQPAARVPAQQQQQHWPPTLLGAPVVHQLLPPCSAAGPAESPPAAAAAAAAHVMQPMGMGYPLDAAAAAAASTATSFSEAAAAPVPPVSSCIPVVSVPLPGQQQRSANLLTAQQLQQVYAPEAAAAAGAAAAAAGPAAARQQIGLKRHALPSLTSWPPSLNDNVTSDLSDAADPSSSEASGLQQHQQQQYGLLLPQQGAAGPAAAAAASTSMALPCPSFEMLDAMNTLSPLNTLDLSSFKAAGGFGCCNADGELPPPQQQQQRQHRPPPQSLGFLESLQWQQMLDRVSAQHQPEEPEQQQRQQPLDGGTAAPAAAAAAPPDGGMPVPACEGMVLESWQVDNSLSMYLGESLDLTGVS